MEMVQCLAEKRSGGETGVRSVQCLVDEEVWKAGERQVYDRKLLAEALSRLKARPSPEVDKLKSLVPNPVLFVIDYRDGLRACVLTLNGAVGEWSAAWKYADGSGDSTLFYTQEARPFMHFAFLVEGIESLVQARKSPWPVERTLLTSGALDALLISKKDKGRSLETPYLDMRYESGWRWKAPPPPPPDRPIDAQ
jgi:hypothetical protein